MRRFFYPKNIAVIGVSPEENNLGKNIVFNCLRFGYGGEIISVGLKGGVIFGQRIYKSLEEVDASVDLAIILTPAKTIPGILTQCGKKGIKRVVIESGGFSETGKGGKRIGELCQQVAEKYGIRFIGPNGIGIINMENGLAMPFFLLQRDVTLGPVSILAQSGGVGLSYLAFLSEERIGINKFISIGNKLNVNENDLLKYLIEDEGTRIILIYLEGFVDGRAFVEIASSSSKPILVHKSNRFKATEQIAHSHTAALSSDDEIVESALEQAGCIRVNTMDDAMDYTKSFTLPPLRGNRLAVVSRSGGHAVISADACAHYGFTLPSFPREFLKKVESKLRAHVIRLQNPLDLGDLFDLRFYEYIVKELLKRDDVDGVLLGHGYRASGPEREASRELVNRVEELVEKYKKPVALFVFTESAEIDYLRRNSKIPIFSAPENAMRAFNMSHKWAKRRINFTGRPSIKLKNTRKARAILNRGKVNGFIELKDSMEFLNLLGIDTVPYRVASNQKDALMAWRSFDSAVSMKLNRPHISHKTEAGAVKLNIATSEQVVDTFRDLRIVSGVKDIEIMIQPMVSGKELIIGGKRDAVFGPVILFGLGGVWVEVLRDVAWRVAPFNRKEARSMMEQIKGWKVLKGMRGEGPYDIKAVENMLIRLSQIMVDFPMIKEIDLNPVFVRPRSQGAYVVDARIIV